MNKVKLLIIKMSDIKHIFLVAKNILYKYFSVVY